MSQPDEWPATVQVTGLPFLFHGWNTTFRRVDLDRLVFEYSDLPSFWGENECFSGGLPVYVLDTYVLYWFLQIRAMEIIYINGEWILRAMDNKEIFYHKPTPDKTINGLLGPWFNTSMTLKAL